METTPTLIVALALLAGVLCQSLARHIRVPGIVPLLAAGVALGPDGLNWVRPDELGHGLLALVDVAVAVILFEGGLNLQVSRLRREQTPIRRLITWGALVTVLGGTTAAHFFMGWGWDVSILFGSLVVVTGPTVIGPLVSELRLKPRVATVLEAEGVLIDPIGAILAVLVLELVLAPTAASVASGALGLLLRLGFGAFIGAVAGFSIARLLARRNWLPEGHENIFVLAAVLLLFNASDALVPHSGILAVTVAGVVVGNMPTPVDRDLREFKDQLTVLLIGLLFIMLAADVRFSEVAGLGVNGLLVVAVLVFVIRPIGVAISTAKSDLSLRERAFIGWVAPRGIVAAAVAVVVTAALEEAGYAGNADLRALVFLTIACTVVLTGLTARPVGTWLGVRLPGRSTVAILGADALGLELARALTEGGCPVVLLDSNPQNARQAEEAGYSVIFGNAVQERTQQRARFENVKTAVALTGNQTLNSVFVERARDLFGVPHGLVAAAKPTGGLVGESIERGDVALVFDGIHDMERWDVRHRRGDVETVRRRFHEPAVAIEESEPGATTPLGERGAILALHRDGETMPYSSSTIPKKGDEVSVAIHSPESEDAYRALEAMGWWEIPVMVDEDDAGEAASPNDAADSGAADAKPPRTDLKDAG